MRILFLIFSFHVGGIERQLAEMANAMACRGHEVHLCVVNRSYDVQMFDTLDEAVSVYRMEREANGEKLQYMRKFCSYVRNHHIQVIHAQEPTGVVFAALARLWVPGLRIYETVHDVGEYQEYSEMQLKLADFFCSGYIAISKTVEEEIRDRGISESRISLIHNAVNCEKFSRERYPVRKHAASDVWNIANVARFFPEKKGQDILIRAVEHIRRTHPDLKVHLYLAGAVYRGQEQAMKAQQDYVRDHQFADVITFCGNVDDVPEFLSAMDVFVLPSRYEGFGIALIEAMAMGIPCVASQLDGPREIMEGHLELGRMFEPGNAESLAEELIFVMQHPELYSGEQISSYARKEYSMDVLVEKHLNLYRSCEHQKSKFSGQRDGQMTNEVLYIVMPAYNEEGNIEKVVEDWYPILNGKALESRLVIADSGSTDSTHNILLKLQKKYSKLEILDNTEKQHGPKLIALYNYAIFKGADYIFQTDSDGQTDSEEFVEFWNVRNEYDAVLGNRRVREDGKSRAFVESVVCFLLKIYFGVSVPDANAPFRLMRATTVAKYMERFRENYNLPNIMLTAFFAYYKDQMVFKEISFKQRQAGVNSINIPNIVRVGWHALRDFGSFRKDM